MCMPCRIDPKNVHAKFDQILISVEYKAWPGQIIAVSWLADILARPAARLAMQEPIYVCPCVWSIIWLEHTKTKVYASNIHKTGQFNWIALQNSTSLTFRLSADWHRAYTRSSSYIYVYLLGIDSPSDALHTARQWPRARSTPQAHVHGAHTNRRQARCATIAFTIPPIHNSFCFVRARMLSVHSSAMCARNWFTSILCIPMIRQIGLAYVLHF